MLEAQDDDCPSQFRMSVVVPTFQRRDLVLTCVKSLDRQSVNCKFEVVVVVDGSTDGTTPALRELKPSCPLVIIEQPNRGRAAACNRGAASARGEILLFLDDDMEADPQLLAEHDRSHRDGADVVLGHIPLHPDSPSNVLSRSVRDWADERGARLSQPGTELGLYDLVTGQMSLPRSVFDGLGGFDTDFTRSGSWGNEDIDLGCRLLSAGYGVVFNPRAVSWQKYVVGTAQNLKQWREAGKADVAFALKHPEQLEAVFPAEKAQQPHRRRSLRSLAGRVRTALLLGPLKWIAIMLVQCGIQSPATARLFFRVRSAGYWRAVRRAGGIPRDRKPAAVKKLDRPQ